MATKKVPAKNDPGRSRNDARKAFEHLGRVQALSSLTVEEHFAIHAMVSMAEAALQANAYKESAHLLRAAEHLSFAAAVATKPTQAISPFLKTAIEEEFDHLLQKAEEHGHAEQAPEAIQAIYTRLRKSAGAAMRRREYQTGLELARGAEALTHLEALAGKDSPGGKLPPAEKGDRARKLRG